MRTLEGLVDTQRYQEEVLALNLSPYMVESKLHQTAIYANDMLMRRRISLVH
jgi:hypothetical protein